MTIASCDVLGVFLSPAQAGLFSLLPRFQRNCMAFGAVRRYIVKIGRVTVNSSISFYCFRLSNYVWSEISKTLLGSKAACFISDESWLHDAQ